MYEPFYGLKSKPFSVIPDPNFIYWAGPHSRAFAMLQYGILNHASFAVITGEIGAGKTTLLRHLMKQLPSDIRVGMLSNTSLERGPLLEWVLMSFGLETAGLSAVGLHRTLDRFLHEQYSHGRRTVLIVDEAQNLGKAALEELRMISNLNTHDEELLQIVLSGQPQLKQLLSDPDLEQFVQRVSSDFHLGLLSHAEAIGYIDHRLAVAGAERVLFSDEACKLIHSASRGTPRLINILCETGLVYGFGMGAPMVTSEIIEKVLQDKRQYGVFPQRLDQVPVTLK